MSFFHYTWCLVQSPCFWGMADVVPIAQSIGLTVNVEGKRFAPCYDILIRTTVAVMIAFKDELMGPSGWKSLLGSTCQDNLSSNQPGHAILYFTFFEGSFLIELEGRVHAGDTEGVEHCMKYFLHLLTAMNRYKYTTLSIRRLAATKMMKPAALEYLRRAELLSQSGRSRHFIPADQAEEHLHAHIRNITGPSPTRSRIEHASKITNSVTAAHNACSEVLHTGEATTWMGLCRDDDWWRTTNDLAIKLKEFIGLTPSRRSRKLGCTKPIKLPQTLPM
eukprot:TRINITY_DN2869_c0_g1::TRINITY_DN2869_c0_g1_i2::g.5360::m.5360 TRINITY_DN2869_c0_g1::TRINITY_DN2869_c0_g1_i2::g.5360  ORF type:complete len:277 (-),score=-10.33 TRINITY_DN2869_c0_g1_i2:610-1440(-)